VRPVNDVNNSKELLRVKPIPLPIILGRGEYLLYINSHIGLPYEPMKKNVVSFPLNTINQINNRTPIKS
jgi:hypothetical protein